MLHHFYLPLSCETASLLYKYMFILVWETPTRSMLLNIILHYINSKKYDINDISLAFG